ncbi:MAG: PIN domain-containing protein [Bacteroidales bacterium]|nr:PIN domain-containing protein [Bacteroidales bacterium]
MKLFLDTNVLLDLLLEREGYEKAVPVFQLQEEGKLSLCVSILTMVNVAYVYRKTVGQRLAVVNLKFLSSLLEVLPMDGPMLQQAIYREGPDFEDILQGVCAAEHQCDYILTNNVADFQIGPGLASAQLPIPPVLSPEAFLKSSLSLHP